jgi:hypothetical protein
VNRYIARILACLALAWAALPAGASFHLWSINEVYSNTDGTVQYIELTALAGAQQFVSSHALKSSSGGITHTYNVTADLPGDTTGKRFLFATAGFAALGLVQPDYIIPNGFVFPAGGTINWADSDIWIHGALPAGGDQSLNRSGVAASNSPTNFAGITGHIQSTAAPTATPSFQGLWWRSPANSESGWGVNLAHQGTFIFATWFTYDKNGQGMWLASLLERSGTTGATFSSTSLYTTTAAPFNAAPWDSSQYRSIPFGAASMTFTDANNGTFTYSYTILETVDGGYGYPVTMNVQVSQTKAITRQVFATPPTCSFTAPLQGAPANYSDLWWKSPANSESGWGINLTHQGNFIFATWFTYGADGKGMWLEGLLSPSGTTGSVFSGTLNRDQGAAFDMDPWPSSSHAVAAVGTASIAFTDANNATFTYTVNGITQTKAIMRQVFASPVSTCQ